MKFVLDWQSMLDSYAFLLPRGPMRDLRMPWRYPDFSVANTRKWRGSATYFDANRSEIKLSRTLIKDASEGLAMMAHEMLHLAQSMAEEDGDDFHGPWFRKHGKRLCRYYGWSHEQFGLRG